LSGYQDSNLGPPAPKAKNTDLKGLFFKRFCGVHGCGAHLLHTQRAISIGYTFKSNSVLL
jgi:hypothetical protein